MPMNPITWWEMASTDARQTAEFFQKVFDWDPEEAPSGTKRLTITLPVIKAARRVWLICTGKGKADILKTVFDSIKAEKADRLPAAGACPTNGQWRWYLDSAAASRLIPDS